MEPYGPYSDYNSFDSAVEALAGLLDTLGSAVDKYAAMSNYRRSEKVYIELEYKQLVDRMAHEKNVRKNH